MSEMMEMNLESQWARKISLICRAYGKFKRLLLRVRERIKFNKMKAILSGPILRWVSKRRWK